MADTTLSGVFLHGVAGSRPAANAVAKGTIYSATDTGAITQSDGVSTWTTWATIAAGASGGTPALVLSTTAVAGVASTFIRDDDQIIAFDATVPVTQAFGDAAATGAAALAARRDHKHGMPAAPTYTSNKWTTGTSMPGGPATNDRVTRTDLGLDFYWDGTRWVSTTLYRLDISTSVKLQGTVAGNYAPTGMMATWDADFHIYFVKWYQSWYSPTNNGSNYWTFTFANGDSGASIASFNTSALSGGSWQQVITTINAVLASGTFTTCLNIVATGSPGTLTYPGQVTYRLIGT